MATTPTILDDAKLAETIVANSNMSTDYKRAYFRLLNTTTMATNGISTDEKIQKMTEAIHSLAVIQALYMNEIDKKIDDAITTSNEKQCHNCKAMSHALEVEKAEERAEIIKEYEDAHPPRSTPVDKPLAEKSWSQIAKELVLKPYPYVVAALLAVSPHGVDILNAIFAFCKQ